MELNGSPFLPALSGVGLAEGLVPVSGLIRQSASHGKHDWPSLINQMLYSLQMAKVPKGDAFRFYFVEPDRLERLRTEQRKCTCVQMTPMSVHTESQERAVWVRRVVPAVRRSPWKMLTLAVG